MKSMTMSAVLAALLASTVAIPAAAAERERGINARQNVQQNRIQRGVRQGDLTRGEARRPQGEARTGRREDTAGRANGEGTAVQADGNSSAGGSRHFDRGSNQVRRDSHGDRDNGQRRFADRSRGYGFGRHGTDAHSGYRGSDQRFAYRGQGHAFGIHGTDRRSWGRGAERRFGSHGSQSRFGNQWGHPSASSRIDRMQAQQRQRIQQGVRSGDLTQREAQRLRAEQRMIRREERAYLADGRLSRGERRDLYGDLRSANQHIYNQTHDAQTRR